MGSGAWSLGVEIDGHVVGVVDSHKKTWQVLDRPGTLCFDSAEAAQCWGIEFVLVGIPEKWTAAEFKPILTADLERLLEEWRHARRVKRVRTMMTGASEEAIQVAVTGLLKREDSLANSASKADAEWQQFMEKYGKPV